MRAEVESNRGLFAYKPLPHPTSCIRFGSGSAKEGPDHTEKNLPGSDLDDLVRFWPNGSGPEASRCARIIRPGSGRSQTARYQLPTLRLDCVLAQTARIILCKTSRDPIGFWLTTLEFG